MSDAAHPSAPEPIAPPEPVPAPGPAPVAAPVNPYVAPTATPVNPYVAPAASPVNPYVAPMAAPAEPGAYQPVPTSPPPAALAPYSTTGAAYAYGPRTSPLAITSLVLSLVGLVTWITGIAGVITGHIALRQIRRTGEGGRGMALAGVIIGYVLTGFLVLYTLFIVSMFVGLGVFSRY